MTLCGAFICNDNVEPAWLLLPSTLQPLKTSCEPGFWLTICDGMDTDAVSPALNHPLPWGVGAPAG